jgi:hypothetical protein
MSLNDFEKFLECSRKSNYTINELVLSGGEPVLWKNIIPALEMIKKYSNIEKTILFTNGTKLISNDIVKNVDKIILSVYGKSNRTVMSQMKKFCINNKTDLKIKRKNRFWPWPNNKLDNTLPGKCVCAYYSVLGDEVAICGQIFELEKRFNLDLSKFKTKVCDNYLDKLNYKLGSFDACQYCIENRKVQDILGKTINHT